MAVDNLNVLWEKWLQFEQALLDAAEFAISTETALDIVDDLEPLIPETEREAIDLLYYLLFGDVTAADEVPAEEQTGLAKISAEFTALINMETKKLVQPRLTTISKSTRSLKKLVKRNVALGKNIQDAFAQTAADLPPLSELESPLDESDTKLLVSIEGGVKETLQIKVDSLNDSILEFESDCFAFIDGFRMNNSLSEEQWQIIYDDVHSFWLDNPPEDFAGAETFFKMAETLPTVAAANKTLNDTISQGYDTIHKKLIKFKKEILLFEVSTYEEILTHSAPRLRDSEWSGANRAAQVLDDAFASLIEILKRNHIMIIRPEIHTQFVAAEHEILIAERHDGFAKGEIIKVMNQGYKQMGQILLRANIIAAR